MNLYDEQSFELLAGLNIEVDEDRNQSPMSFACSTVVAEWGHSDA